MGIKGTLLLVTARHAVVEIRDGGYYNTKKEYEIKVNGRFYEKTNRTITSIYGLKPQNHYVLEIGEGQDWATISLTTAYEFVTLDVRDFGAAGDGIEDDTTKIQAAIMACPRDSRVWLPKGTYRITSLFLKSNINIELGEGAVLLADNNRFRYPVFPGLIESYDEKGEYNLGTWEGNPLKMFAGILTGIQVENVVIYGKGSVNGNATKKDWWHEEKVMRGAFRPRMVFLNQCNHIVIEGIAFHDSPSWVIHPYFCENLTFLGLTIRNPQDSPNTDGLDPESCKKVRILGVHFSLGDDCVALKSGKIYMGSKYGIPCEDITIRQCLMENGHGAVTVGSEMAAGIQRVRVSECRFAHTDRGLRIKLRRGRGEKAVLDAIVFEHIFMDQVKTPFVVNCFYFCDPDGKSQYVQSRECLPVDHRTPGVKKLVFKNVECKGCQVAAAWFYGLPERKIEEIRMENISISFDKDAQPDVPAMLTGIEPCCRKGIYANNIRQLILKNVVVKGQDGPTFVAEQVDCLERD